MMRTSHRRIWRPEIETASPKQYSFKWLQAIGILNNKCESEHKSLSGLSMKNPSTHPCRFRKWLWTRRLPNNLKPLIILASEFKIKIHASRGKYNRIALKPNALKAHELEIQWIQIWKSSIKLLNKIDPTESEAAGFKTKFKALIPSTKIFRI